MSSRKHYLQFKEKVSKSWIFTLTAGNRLLGLKAILETNSTEVGGESNLLCNPWLGVRPVWIEFKDDEGVVNNEELGEEENSKEFNESPIRSAIEHKFREISSWDPLTEYCYAFAILENLSSLYIQKQDWVEPKLHQWKLMPDLENESHWIEGRLLDVWFFGWREIGLLM